jgi:L-ascorbate metabolism protein UlaG (beta-lactamase superfamily)
MAEVANSGPALIEAIRQAEVPEGAGRFWWLGQHSFIVKLGGTTVYIDPYLEPNPARQTPPLFAPEEITNADLVLCTHDHLDHIDPFALQGIIAASPGAIFVAPRPHKQRMLDIGVPAERLRLLLPDEEWSHAGVSITGVKAKHEFFEEGPEGFPYLGYVLTGNGVTCYHSGDTVIYEGLRSRLNRWKLDAAFLPINGRDAVRFRSGCIGNMTYQEAVDLAGELGVGLAVPSHWDMFAMNSEDPQKFVDYLEIKFPGVPSWVGEAGETVAFGSGT